MIDPEQIIRRLAVAKSLRELHDAQSLAVRYINGLDTPNNHIDLLALDRVFRNALMRSGRKRISDLRGLSVEQLKLIHGIGDGGARQIQQAIYMHDHPAIP